MVLHFICRHLTLGLVAALLLTLGCSTTSESQEHRSTLLTNDSLEVNEFRQREARRVEDLLVGQVAGVQVRQTSAGLQVQIRGPSSFLGSSEPLYVVDGMPIEAGPGGALRGLNPHDIESIRVLKNPSDTSMYGIRGANGVVVIATKRASPRDDDD